MRSELKYLVPIEVMPELRARLAPFTILDRHGRGFEERGYTVRSVYLDSASLRYYYEKDAGINVRRKLRVRGYNTGTSTDWLFLEIKRKVGSKVAKNRAPVRVGDVSRLFETGDVDRFVRNTGGMPLGRDDARRFFYHVHRYRLRPSHLTVYEREAFLGRFDATLRVTFDRNLRGGSYPSLDTLFSDRGLRHVFPRHFVLEVKYNTRFPEWLRPVLSRYELRNRSISKYCLCAEINERHDDNKIAVLANAARLPTVCPARMRSPNFASDPAHLPNTNAA